MADGLFLRADQGEAGFFGKRIWVEHVVSYRWAGELVSGMRRNTAVIMPRNQRETGSNRPAISVSISRSAVEPTVAAT